jgi:hypothetical protein
MAALHASFIKVVEGPDFRLNTRSCMSIRQSSIEVLQWIDKFPEKAEIFERTLLDLFRPIMEVQVRSSFSKKELMWKEFHKLRLSECFSLTWTQFLYPHIISVAADPIMIQFVSKDMFEGYVKSLKPEQSKPQSSDIQHLTKEELYALRYAAGYVLRSVTAKYSGKDDVMSGVLSEMQVQISDIDNNMGEESELAWTTEWVQKLDRGRLVKVSDQFYALVLSLEMTVRLYFNNTALHNASQSDSQTLPKDKLIGAALDNDDVQFYWCLLMTGDLDERASQELLHEIVHLWVTVRGFSFTKSWLEKYKSSKGKGIRKELKKKDNNKCE